MADRDPEENRKHATKRTIDTPCEAVFDAFRDPLRLARWWGPEGFSSTFETFDFREGGRWRFTMHGPDGKDYPNESLFREVSAQRVVVEHLSDVHHFVLTITFTAIGAATEVAWRQVFDTPDHYRRVESIVVAANEQNLDRLAAEVAGPGGR